MKCVAAMLLVAAGCGDNSQECGPGTIDKDGVCVPSAMCGPGTTDSGMGTCIPDGTSVCADGTKFDPATDRCLLDPNACQGGTILVGNACVDPTTQLTVDLEEAFEPNGLGLLGEASTTPAGVFVPNPVGGSPFVIHGHIRPFEDANGDGQIDPDIDTYEVMVTAPTVLRITAIGLGGIDGGFVAVDMDTSGALGTWQRLGFDLSGTASRRDLYLPSAGTYLIGIADARTLVIPGSAAGGDNAEYYVTVEMLDVPTPSPLALAASNASATGTIGSAVSLYTITLPTGTATIKLAMPAVQALASEVIAAGDAVIAVANETGMPATASLAVTGPSDTTIVVDDVVNYAVEPVPYTLTIHVAP